jgi:homoserine kinase
VLIEPQRAKLVPGFLPAKRAAIDAGALGCSISGAGPSVFAWSEEGRAEAVRDAMREAFRGAGVDCDHWIASIGGDGARIVERR